MNKGEIAWMIPNGDTPPAVRDHPRLKGLTLPKTGSPSQAGLLVTKTLLFAPEGPAGQPILHVYDKATGAEIWQTPIPGPQVSLPMTYLHQGRQFVVFGVRGAGGAGAQLVAYAIPAAAPAGGGRGGRGGGERGEEVVMASNSITTHRGREARSRGSRFFSVSQCLGVTCLAWSRAAVFFAAFSPSSRSTTPPRTSSTAGGRTRSAAPRVTGRTAIWFRISISPAASTGGR